MQTQTLAEIVKARRKDIAEQAECEGCGATLAACKANRGKDPTAPPWFGCCAIGTAMAPCSHRPNVRLMDALLTEIESGAVRPVAEIVAEREAKEQQRQALRAAATPPGESRPLGYADRINQGEWWMTKHSGWIRIADMDRQHRVNTVRFLEQRAATVAQRYSLSLRMQLGDAPDEVVDSAIQEDQDRAEAPLAWLRTTPLYRALSEGLDPDEPYEIAVKTGHVFAGMGATCSHPVGAGAGDDFIRCGEPPENHPVSR